jgi:hypothetical protein
MDSTQYRKLKDLTSSIRKSKRIDFRLSKRITSQELPEKGSYRIITHKNMSGGLFTEYPHDTFISSNIPTDNIIEIGDILVSLNGPEFNSCVVESLNHNYVAGSGIAIIKSNNNHYLNAFFNSKTGHSLFQREAQKNSKEYSFNAAEKSKKGLTSLSIESLSNLSIPYYPIDDLNKFVNFRYSDSSIYESEISNSLVIKLESIGWKVSREYRIDEKYSLDLAMLIDGKLETFIEIKRGSRNQFAHGSLELNEQLNTYLKLTECKYAYCFFDGNLFSYSNNYFKQIENFPQPKQNNQVAKETNIDYEFFKEILAENLTLKKKLENSILSNDKLDQVYSEILIIKETTARTEEKINSVLKILNTLSTDFIKVKESNSELDEKLIKLNIELENSLKIIYDNNYNIIAKYERILENLFGFEWDKFEDLSKSYLPAAEFLFDELSKLEHPDLSPFILQYCKALENEILQKIFRNYVQDLKNRNINFDSDFEWDISLDENKKPNSDNTYRLARHLIKCLNTGREKWFFELGSMHTYLQYLTGNTIKKSQLLQDLKAFLFKYFEKNILETEFLLRIKKITEEFRNKAAHPNQISIAEAERGKKEIRSILKDFLEMYNVT